MGSKGPLTRITRKSWKKKDLYCINVYSPADQRIFPYHLKFVDLDQLVPDLLEEKTSIFSCWSANMSKSPNVRWSGAAGPCSAGRGPLHSPADQRIFPYHLMFLDLEQLFPVQLEEDFYILLLISEYFLITRCSLIWSSWFLFCWRRRTSIFSCWSVNISLSPNVRWSGAPVPCSVEREGPPADQRIFPDLMFVDLEQLSLLSWKRTSTFSCWSANISLSPDIRWSGAAVPCSAGKGPLYSPADQRIFPKSPDVRWSGAAGPLSAGRGPLYSPADQRIFPNHLMFVDL